MLPQVKSLEAIYQTLCEKSYIKPFTAPEGAAYTVVLPKTFKQTLMSSTLEYLLIGFEVHTKSYLFHFCHPGSMVDDSNLRVYKVTMKQAIQVKDSLLSQNLLVKCEDLLHFPNNKTSYQIDIRHSVEK